MIKHLVEVLKQLAFGSTGRQASSLNCDDHSNNLLGSDVNQISQAINFPAHLGLSENYKELIQDRLNDKGGRLLTSYPSDDMTDDDTCVDRNILSQQLLWASRRDENSSIKRNLENEVIKMLELNIKYHDAPYPFDALRVLYSKRKDWENAARVLDEEFLFYQTEWGKKEFALGEDGEYAPKYPQETISKYINDWERKRERVRKYGF